MAKLNFGGTEENVVTREEFPLSKAQEVLKNETVAVIGYGVGWLWVVYYGSAVSCFFQ